MSERFEFDSRFIVDPDAGDTIAYAGVAQLWEMLLDEFRFSQVRARPLRVSYENTDILRNDPMSLRMTYHGALWMIHRWIRQWICHFAVPHVPPILSDKMYLLISLTRSTPPQNRKLNIGMSNSKQ